MPKKIIVMAKKNKAFEGIKREAADIWPIL
jgi:hypothetical protein